MAFIGIDVSKKKLDVLWLRDRSRLKVKTRVFANVRPAFKDLITWLTKQTGERPEQIHVVLEPTSVYHEQLTYTLHKAGFRVYLANPARAKDFARSEGTLNKTDQRDALTLALYGVEKHERLTLWQPEPEEIRHMRALVARVDALEQDRQRELNRLEKALATETSEEVLNSIRGVIAHLEAEIKRLNKDIDDHIDRHPGLKQDRALLRSIPGIAAVTSVELLGVLRSRPFRSARQCAAFLGLTPVHCQSGTLNKASRISKAGKARLRKKLYMAAVTALSYNPDIRALKERLKARGKSGRAIVVAAMRRLVHIAFGVLKHQQEYAVQSA